MHILSVNVGRSETITWRSQSRKTGINKRPVEGPVRIGPNGLEGDVQVDRRVHGGAEKAVYIYPAEHYDWWRETLGAPDLPYGAFGENLTVSGLDEADMHVGDELTVGSATLVVLQPRLPCGTLAMRMQRADMQKLFLRSGRTGFYLGVKEEGEVRAGDPVSVSYREPHGVRIADLVAYHVVKGAPAELLRRALKVPSLPGDWRGEFEQRLAAAS